MTKYLYYNHPAVPPPNIKVGQWYSLDELKTMYSMDYIVYYFFPANFGWESCEEIYPKKKEIKQTKK